MGLVNHYLIPLLIVILTVHFDLCNAIRCWDCNSAYDPRCGEKFDNATLEMVDCDQQLSPIQGMGDKKATLCRTVTQEMPTEVRIVRSCGWLEDEGQPPCFSKAGTNNVKITYCACKTDGCNPATTLQLLPSLLGLPLVLRLF